MVCTFCTLLLALFMSLPAMGRFLPALPPLASDKTLNLHSPLQEAAALAAGGRLDAESLCAALAKQRITVSAQREVHVEIVGPQGSDAVSAAFVASFGGRVQNRVLHLTDCWIPLGRLLDCARALPPGYFINNPYGILPADVQGEGPGVVNSSGYPGGDGVTVAVLDLGFAGLEDAIDNGDAPQNAVAINHTGEPFHEGSIHGTGCVEAVFDHAPAAADRLYKANTNAGTYQTVFDAAAHNVDILSVSLSSPTDGWHDNEGDFAAALNYAAGQGMLVFHSAGNYAQRHYQGTYHPSSGHPSWHEFWLGDQTIDIDIAGQRTVTFSLLWNRAGGTYNYDLYLFDTNLNVLASGTNPGNYYEWFSWTNPSSDTVRVHLAVWRHSGGVTEFEIYTHGGFWQEYMVGVSSVPAPNSTHPNVLKVGAVSHEFYDWPPGSMGIIAGYSSRGPTNDGTAMPSLCGPTNTASFVYGGPMGGTSNAAPNCAGAAACFMSADPQLSVDGVRWMLLEMAAYWRDWGDSGHDLTYGRGGLFLADFQPQRIWVASACANWNNLRGLPCATVAGALLHAPAGGNVQVFPGGHYPEALTINQQVTLRTEAELTVIGP